MDSGNPKTSFVPVILNPNIGVSFYGEYIPTIVQPVALYAHQIKYKNFWRIVKQKRYLSLKEISNSYGCGTP
jgi:hypothetical protein